MREVRLEVVIREGRRRKNICREVFVLSGFGPDPDPETYGQELQRAGIIAASRAAKNFMESKRAEQQ